MVGKIERVRIRDIFKFEDRHFTTWMEENIEALNEQLGLQLTCTARELRVGTFSLDIEAEDADGRRVIIENQLEKSDHDHLGKLITYLSNLDASAAIWITTEPRPEHITAIAWLNESYAADFYLIKLEGIRIGNSEPAPLFTQIVGPSEESKDVGAIKKEDAERHHLRREFWASLQKRLKGKTNLHSNLTPTKDSWWATTSGVPGIVLLYNIFKDSWGVELCVDHGKKTEEENHQVFESIQSHQSEIEAQFGKPLQWMRQERRRLCRIRYNSDFGGGLANENQWPQIQDAMIEQMIDFERVLRPYLNKMQ